MSEIERHTPMRPIWDGGGFKRSVVGYQCGHCEGIWTANMNPSQAQRHVSTNPGFEGRFVPNKAHRRRLKAA